MPSRALSLRCLLCLTLLACATVTNPVVAQPQAPASDAQPPIPITFQLDKPAVVTLVIEDAQGVRVRNVVADRQFPAGENTVYWDGMDESVGRVGIHGIYEIAGKLVSPGTYRVRGLKHQPLTLRYQFTANNIGSPPWHTSDGRGGWTADHTPARAILFLPEQKQIMIGSFVAEDGDGLIWTDLKGKKLGGVRWLGGTWAATSLLARDDGAKRQKNVLAYITSSWYQAGTKTKTIDTPGELRLSIIDSSHKTASILIQPGFPNRETAEPSGLAARDGIVLVAQDQMDQMLVVDPSTASKGNGATILATVPAKDIGGLTFDKQGNLLAIVGNQVHRYKVGELRSLKTLPAPTVLVAEGLEDPQQLTTDSRGEIYVSDWGNSHQVKVFSEDGKPLRTIGKAGAPKTGEYEPLRMQHPHQIAVSDDDRLWVAEEDFLPKRISVWQRNGELDTDFIGPPDYGAGGEIDPRDAKRFYYADWHAGAMELELDWQKGTSKVKRVYYRPSETDQKIHAGGSKGKREIVSPQTPIYLGGRQYMMNLYNTKPISFPSTIGIWLYEGDTARLAAAAGDAYHQFWLREPAMMDRWPEDIDLKRIDDARYTNENPVIFAWSDSNGDSTAQPDEVTCARAPTRFRSVSVDKDLSMLCSTGQRLVPVKIDDRGVPHYDLGQMNQVIENMPRGADLLEVADEQYVLTGGPLKGFIGGALKWTYPNQWPSLHAGHSGPPQRAPGQLIATTKIVGAHLKPPGADTQPIWAYNGDRGDIYLFTSDGLFVSQLFQGAAKAKARWDTLDIRRGTDVAQTNIPGENFWPRVTQTADGNIYVITGKSHSSIVKIEGLETLAAIAPKDLELTAEILAKVPPYLAKREQERQANLPAGELTVPALSASPKVDGKLDEWKEAQWVKVDDDIQAAMAVDDDRLYVAYRSEDSKLLNNQPQSLPLLFKTGGALDVMLGGTDGDASRNQRLLVTRAEGKTMAALYRPVVKGTPADQRVAFSSPWRTIHFDSVQDVSEQVDLAVAANTEQVVNAQKQSTQVTLTGYELSVPLSLVNLSPARDRAVHGDIGVLLGLPGQTTQRLYWHNKGTSLVNDVPGEAELQPGLWGVLRFTVADKAAK